MTSGRQGGRGSEMKEGDYLNYVVFQQSSQNRGKLKHVFYEAIKIHSTSLFIRDNILCGIVKTKLVNILGGGWVFSVIKLTNIIFAMAFMARHMK